MQSVRVSEKMREQTQELDQIILEVEGIKIGSRENVSVVSRINSPSVSPALCWALGTKKGDKLVSRQALI